MKRFLSLCLALILGVMLCIPAGAASDPIRDIQLDCQGAYLFNPETGTALFQKCADTRMYPASTTKIMTALVALDHCKDPKNESVTVPDTALFASIIEDGGMNMEMSKGEVFTVFDLLCGMMINSYCDCAQLLAYHFGGDSVENFVAMMNEKSASLGLKNTNFENAHGLHSNNHYSSPRDMAQILLAAIGNPDFVQIISLRSGTIPATEFHAARSLRYTVSMFYDTNSYFLPSIVGGKSGFTDQAGRCLATYSRSGDVSYILVLLGGNLDPFKTYSENVTYSETNFLVSYAFENFSLQTLYSPGDVIASLPVVDADVTIPVTVPEKISVLCRNGAAPDYSIQLPESLSAPEVADGKEIGTFTPLFDDREVRPASLTLSYDGTEIHVKSDMEKAAVEAMQSISGIFREDKIFVTLLVILLLVIAVCLPLFRFLRKLRHNKSHTPKH